LCGIILRLLFGFAEYSLCFFTSIGKCLFTLLTIIACYLLFFLLKLLPVLCRCFIGDRRIFCGPAVTVSCKGACGATGFTFIELSITTVSVVGCTG
jgi:hypothetical protein